MKMILVTAIAALTMTCLMQAETKRSGSFSKQTTVTGFKGKTATRNASGSFVDGQFTHQTSSVGPNGGIRSTQSTGTYGNGTRSRTTTKTVTRGKR